MSMATVEDVKGGSVHKRVSDEVVFGVTKLRLLLCYMSHHISVSCASEMDSGTRQRLLRKLQADTL